MFKRAYTLEGKEIPYDSEDFNLRLSVAGRRLTCEHKGLPSIVFSFSEAITYMPESLAKRVHDDLREIGGNGLVLLSFMELPDSEIMARGYVESILHLRAGGSSVGDRFLSTVVD